MTDTLRQAQGERYGVHTLIQTWTNGLELHTMLDDWSFRTPHYALRIMYLVISYDIKDDRQRLKIHKALKDYGTWVQYSVFECHVTKVQYLYLRHRLKHLLGDDDEGSIRFYRLCEQCKQKIERIGGIVPHEGVTVVV